MTEPRLLMTVIGDDAEPVLVDAHDQIVELALDDGRVIALDRAELRAAIDDDHKRAA